MVALYGRDFTRRELAERSGMLSQFAGVRLMTLGDGVERGTRLLEFRTGTGLRFTVLVDRTLDIAELDYKGIAIGWHSPSGFRNPFLHEGSAEGGLGWLRSFSGLLVTCGLDHTFFNYEAPADHFFYGARSTVAHTIHGRISAIPARLTGYGEAWEGDDCTLWCEGIVQQSTVFGEDLHLMRRIEVKVGSNEIRLSDRVVNHGFYRTPHMYLYHINAGAPLLGEGARYVAPIAESIYAGHADRYHDQGVGYRTLIGPQLNFVEQVWEHETKADAGGLVPVALVNDALGLAFEIETRKDQFPVQVEWQNFQAGQYTIGLEPSTHHVMGHKAALDRGEMIWLEHDESRSYDTTFRIHDGSAALAKLEARIAAIAPTVLEEYPAVTGNFRELVAR
jgi:hypothetical protein